MSDELNPEDVIRNNARRLHIADAAQKIRRAGRQPYATMAEFERMAKQAATWTAGVTSGLAEWGARVTEVLDTNLLTQSTRITELEERVAELELRARTRDDYEAEMRDRG